MGQQCSGTPLWVSDVWRLLHRPPTDRQLSLLTTFSDLVGEARERIRADAVAAGMPDDGVPLRDGGTGATAYAEAVGVYLAFACGQVERTTGRPSVHGMEYRQHSQRFGRQAIPMVWDYAEANPFSDSSGNLFAWRRAGYEYTETGL